MCGIQNFAQSYKDHRKGKVKIRTPCHRVKLALVALVFIGPTSRVVLVRLKPNLENSCFIPLSKQVQTCSGLALAHTGSNLFELDMYKHVLHSEFCSVLQRPPKR